MYHHFFGIFEYNVKIEMQLPSHLKLAIEGSIQAAKAIMDIYSSEYESTYKSDGSPVTTADFTSSSILMEYLNQTKIPVISEELDKANYATRKAWDLVWIVDPLDGTKEFIRRNGEFVICVALVKNGDPIFGIITHPVSETILLGGKEYGCTHISFADVNQPEAWKLIDPSPLNQPIVLSSSRTPYRSNEKELIDQLEERFSTIEYSKKGSALKFFDLALGKSDIYPRFAPTMEWDIAAGHAIMQSIGGDVINLEESKPLKYNKESLYNPHFIVYTQALKEAMDL